VDGDKAAAQQPTAWAERVALPGVLVQRCREQAEDEVDSRAAASDVVLQVAVQALVSKVDVGCEADQKGVLLEWCELEQLRQAFEPGTDAIGLRQLVTRDRRQQAVDFGF
jgi:hypothetical protein